MRSLKQFIDDEECTPSNLRVILLQLRHDQVKHLLDEIVRSPAKSFGN